MHLPLPQVAANTRGIQLVQELIREYSLPVVSAYMSHIQVGVTVYSLCERMCERGSEVGGDGRTV